MQQPSEAWRSQVEISSLDSNFSYDPDMPETDSQSSQDSQSSHDETCSQSLQDETGSPSSQDIQSSHDETCSLSSQDIQSSLMETDSPPSQGIQSSQMDTDRQSSQMETDSHCSRMKDSPEIKTSQAIPLNVPVPLNRAVISTTRRNSRSLDDMKHVKQVYFYREHIGSETSTREFKRGLGDLKGNLRTYGSAFLNNKGGVLMIGVDDNGCVLGNNINFKDQDKYRRMAVDVLPKFKPPLCHPNYELEFVPVERGVEEIPPEETPDFKDLMVLRISFERPAGCRKLYRPDKGREVYIRHDVTVQQMKEDDIHNWYDQKWTDEVKQLDKENQQLAKENDELRRDKVKQLAKENDELKRVSILQKRKKTAPASEEADPRKSPRKGKHGSMAVLVMKNNEDNDNLKTRGEEENRKHRSRKQISQDRGPLRSLTSGNTVMEEKSTSRNAGRLM